MRLVAAAVLVALSAAPSAQTHLADSTGTFVGLQRLSLKLPLQTEPGDTYAIDVDGVVGRRYASGLDVGLRMAAQRGSFARTFRLAPTVGYTRPLALGVLARVEGVAEYASASANEITGTDAQGFPTAGWYGFRALTGDVTATVSRPVRVLGSIRLHPTVGGYATAIRAFDVQDPAAQPSPAGLNALGVLPDGDQQVSGTGYEMSLPLTFRLFGRSAALVPRARIQTSGDAYALRRSLGADPLREVSFRLNF